MKKIIILLIITTLAASCATHKQIESKTDESGGSFKNAVIIKSKSETTGVSAEYKWISRHYPSAKVVSQSLVFHNKKPYDIIKIKNKGKAQEVYFDISNFFGKY